MLSDVEKNYKVDYRLGVMINQKFGYFGNIEVGKQASVGKMKDDHMKLVLEAKTIIQRIIGPFYFLNPSSFSVFSLQICGLKADLLKTTLKSPSKYITERICERIRVPISPTNSDQMTRFFAKPFVV